MASENKGMRLSIDEGQRAWRIISMCHIELNRDCARPHIGARKRLQVARGVAEKGLVTAPEKWALGINSFFTTRGAHQGGGQDKVVSVSAPPLNDSLARQNLTPGPDQSQSSLKATSGGTETVLLIEDDKVIRALICYVLRQSGFFVLDLSDGQEALRICREHASPIHLLIADVVMPRMGGHQVAAAVRAIRPETRVLFVSGHTEETVSHYGVGQQDNFLRKPFGPAALVRKVRQVLDHQ